MVRRAFDTLEIDITKDKRQIKKAYSRLVKEYHPEENPGEWARIHEAYETAMRYAEEEYESIWAEEEYENIWAEEEYENIGAEESYGEIFRQA